MNLKNYFLVNKPIYKEFDVIPLKKYVFEFNLFLNDYQLAEMDSYLVRFNFDDLELTEQELKINYLSISKAVGYYRYIDLSNKQQSVRFNVYIPDRIRKLSISIEKWKGTFDLYVSKDIRLLETDVFRKELSFKYQLEKIEKNKIEYERKIKYYRDQTKEIKNNVENTKFFMLGYTLIHSTKSFKNFVRLPKDLFNLYKNKKRINSVQVDDKIEIKPKKIGNKLITNLKEVKALSILDPISEHCWGTEFSLFPLERKKFMEHIAISNADFAFFESAWQANKKSWIYAFNSPELKHANAQDLLKSIEYLHQRQIPTVFWNKEDPMHYKMFLSIAKKMDYIFTTDSNLIEQYQKDCSNKNVFSLKFAAPIKETNPINRFKTKNQSVCFAGTYYAKNHSDRKKQMDSILPALLEYDGVIYDRASDSKSENYEFPAIYEKVIQPSIPFEEMIPTYKKFKVFLNVNTITNSPTMMSRRVYELLACGTPVISTPSKAITEQFSGIVITVRNVEETKMALNKLLTDQDYWYKISHLGYRKVMSEHTYEIRSKEILNALKLPFEERQVVLGIIYKIENIEFLLSIKDFLENQVDNKIHVVFNIEEDESIIQAINNIFEKSSLEYSVSFKKFIEIAQEMKKNVDYIVPLSSENMYYKNYIADLLLPFKYTNCTVSTKKSFYHNNNQLTDTQYVHTYVESTYLYSSVIRSKSLSEIEIKDETIEDKNNKELIYSADQFSFIKDIGHLSLQAYKDIEYKYSTSVGI